MRAGDLARRLNAAHSNAETRSRAAIFVSDYLKSANQYLTGSVAGQKVAVAGI